MAQSLTVLIAEDSAADAELLVMELGRAGFEPRWQRVETEPDYLQALHDGVDLVISDFRMPQFNGLRALDLLRQQGCEIPFILVSGTIGEDAAVEAMKRGATDYLLKDRLGRLGSTVKRALEESRLRKQTKRTEETLLKSEQRLREIFDGMLGFVALFSADGDTLEINRASSRTAGLSREELIGEKFRNGPWWAHSVAMQKKVGDAVDAAGKGATVTCELVAEVEEGKLITVDAVFNPLRDASGAITGVVGSGIDITSRKEAEQKIRDQLDELLRWQEMMLNREDRVQSLKAEVNELLVLLNRPPRYQAPDEP